QGSPLPSSVRRASRSSIEGKPHPTRAGTSLAPTAFSLRVPSRTSRRLLLDASSWYLSSTCDLFLRRKGSASAHHRGGLLGANTRSRRGAFHRASFNSIPEATLFPALSPLDIACISQEGLCYAI